MKITVKGIKKTVQALEEEKDYAIRLLREATEMNTRTVETAAKVRLIEKDLDTDRVIERSMRREIREDGTTVRGEVQAKADESYPAEVGPEGGFLFVALEMNKRRIQDTYVYVFQGRYK